MSLPLSIPQTKRRGKPPVTHKHKIGDQSPFHFLYFRGKGVPEAMAQGLKTAMAAQHMNG